MSSRRWLLTMGAVSLAMSACVGSHPVTVPDEEMTLGVANGTTIAVDIVVGGVTVERVPPSTSTTLTAAQLPTLPWHVQALSPSGRALLFLDVNAGDVQRYPSGFGQGISGVGKRADLSCGRLDVYSGPPLSGPMPGPGVPGDCD